jgi:diaminohydroxyphosphoribosylaminopyrimidine deaminase/5-amino-6-(5-phosphoribosylamino)uracil reductase
MKRALELAQMGKFYAAPNPKVGAVIVHKNKIIGEGFHRNYGEAHAEVNAVNSILDKSLLNKSTIYVTLEPCSHFGKTPPCTDLLIQHQFKRVVICNQDPFEKVDGSGIAKLKAAGIKVEIGCLKNKGLEINKRFFTFQTKKRPYIILKWAESKDGFIAKDSQKQTWISNSISKQMVHLWRSEEAAILVGKNTVLADNPELTTRLVAGKNPTRIIIDEKLELAQTLSVFNSEAKTIVLNAVEDKVIDNLCFIKKELRENLPKVIAEVCFQNNLQSIIIEGGASILNQFLEKQLWDEARVFIGNVNFIEGLSAPTHNLAPNKIELIMQNQLHYYINPNT